MSFLKELQLQHEVSQVPHLSLEEINISLEGLSLSKIKELVVKGIKKVRDFFIKIFKWIKEKVLKFFKSNKVEEVKVKAKVISNIESISLSNASKGGIKSSKSLVSKIISSVTNSKSSKEVDTVTKVLSPPPKIPVDTKIYDKIYSDNDVKEKIGEFFKGRYYGVAMLFDFKKGLLIDFDKLISVMAGYVEEKYRYIKELAETKLISDKFSTELQNAIDENSSHNMGESIIKVYEILGNYDNDEDFFNNAAEFETNTHDFLRHLTKEEVFKWNDKDLLDKYFNKSSEFYNRIERSISKTIKYLEDLSREGLNKNAKSHLAEDYGTNKFYNTVTGAINISYSLLKIIAVPGQILSTYIQLLDYICNKFSSKEYLIDPNPPKYKHLYHLSDNPELVKPEKKTDILYPLVPETGGGQILPPRISFCEDKLNCCYGTPKYFIQYNTDDLPPEVLENLKLNKMKDDLTIYGDRGFLYLYEGIQTDKTQFIKNEFVLAAVGEAAYSKEICVVSDIEVKKVAKVKIHYDHGLPIWHPRKFAEMEIVEEY